MSLPYQKKLIPQAKTLRKEMTPQERHLWYDFLKNHPVRFQRQKTIGRWIVDFYCHAAKLAVELDGSQHYVDVHQHNRDAERTLYLNAMSVEIMRFPNACIDRDFVSVCNAIDRRIKEKTRL